jgi:hypothetical protein
MRKMENQNEITVFLLIPLGDRRRRSFLRGVGLWRRFLVEWRRRPSDPGKEQSAIPASVTPNLDLFCEGHPNPPQRQASAHPGHTPRPPLTFSFSYTTYNGHALKKKPRPGKRECLPRDDDGWKVLKRNSTHSDIHHFVVTQSTKIGTVIRICTQFLNYTFFINCLLSLFTF